MEQSRGGKRSSSAQVAGQRDAVFHTNSGAGWSSTIEPPGWQVKEGQVRSLPNLPSTDFPSLRHLYFFFGWYLPILLDPRTKSFPHHTAFSIRSPTIQLVPSTIDPRPRKLHQATADWWVVCDRHSFSIEERERQPSDPTIHLPLFPLLLPAAGPESFVHDATTSSRSPFAPPAVAPADRHPSVILSPAVVLALGILEYGSWSWG